MPRRSATRADAWLSGAISEISSSAPSSRQAYSVHVIEAGARYRADNWLQREALPLRGF